MVKCFSALRNLTMNGSVWVCPLQGIWNITNGSEANIGFENMQARGESVEAAILEIQCIRHTMLIWLTLRTKYFWQVLVFQFWLNQA